MYIHSKRFRRPAMSIQCTETLRYSLCDSWEFTPCCCDDFLSGQAFDSFASAAEITTVRIPHSVCELPVQYADSSAYQLISGYRRTITVCKRSGMRYILQFDGAAHIAELYVNGTRVMEHRSGYTAFTVDITEFLTQIPEGSLYAEADNKLTATHSCLVAVRLDSTENSSIPPFGFVIDYLTYGGLYRPVWLLECPETRIDDVFVYTRDLGTVHAEATVIPAGLTDGFELHFTVLDAAGNTAGTAVSYHNVPTGHNAAHGLDFVADIPVYQPHCWNLSDPYLYTLHCELIAGSTVHTCCVRFGIRTAEFRADGFYLNGTKTFLTGLNRHQSFPYIGYAAPKSLQRLDAVILKNELCVNAVRTSHYPQSHDFIDACDELGLLVFTEIPGWQHIGSAPEWQNQVLENTREMIMQYRNHPSIVLWGVRINESVDCDALYTETNRIAHSLDPSRATSGVRYLEKSHLLEDVYAFNDFSYAGKGIRSGRRRGPAAKARSKVSPARDKAFLISECNGHMFPVKAWDTWERREEQALRHAAVLNDALADGTHAGCFEWCMFDYQTHKDFGSGDRVCYHGVTDCFRNPKTAAYLYSSQADISSSVPVLEVSTNMDIGDYNAGRLEKCYVFTNADTVKLYKNDRFVTALAPSEFEALAHGPLCVDDTIGCLLETEEGFTGRKEKLLHKALTAAARYGIAGLPLTDLIRMGWCMLRYHLRYEDGVALFGKYVGNWGQKSVIWRFDAIYKGRVVLSKELSPALGLRFEVKPSATVLTEGATFDMALVRIRILNESGSPVPYAIMPVSFSVTGPIELVGPDSAATQGGMTGTLVRTTGGTGPASLTIRAANIAPVTVNFTVEAGS